MFKFLKKYIIDDSDLIQVWLTRKQLEILHKLIKENDIPD